MFTDINSEDRIVQFFAFWPMKIYDVPFDFCNLARQGIRSLLRAE